LSRNYTSFNQRSISVKQPIRLAGADLFREKKVLLVDCWWLVCSERKVLLAGG
jgi:hypothetical protein